MTESALERVKSALDAQGQSFHVAEFSESTRTSEEAAAAIGCEVGQIAKSLIFQRKSDGAALLVIASGANRVHEKKLARLAGGAIRRPNADFVRERGKEIWELDWEGTDAHVIDGSKCKDDVLDELKALVWSGI